MIMGQHYLCARQAPQLQARNSLVSNVLGLGESVTMETSPEPALKPHRWPIEAAVILALSFVAIFALHGKMQPAILRAETGYYQVIAHTSPRHERTMLRSFWTKSSHGHYTPLAFTAEFLFAKHVGLRPNWWRDRQLFLGALLIFFLFGFIRAAAAQTGAPPFAAALLAAAITLIFVAQPLMRNILEWPFHGLQIAWMIFAAATGWGLVRLPNSPNKDRLLWQIALTAYGSMHVLGLGLAVVTGTLGVFSLILIGAVTGSLTEFKSHVRALGATLIFLAVAGFLHTFAMIVLNNAPASAGLNAGRLPDWHQLVGLYALLPISIVAGLIGASLDKGVIDSVLHSAWLIGAAVVLTIGLFVVVLAKRSRQICTRPRLAALCLASFSGVMLVTLVAMISMREIREPTSVGLFGYLTGARYVLPFTVSWLGIVLSALMLLSPHRLVFVAVISGLFAVGAIVGHRSYESHVRARTAPLHGASHIQVWRDLVQIAREARAANLPIPNIPLASLSGFSYVDFKYLEPLLHDELGLPPNEHDTFLDWKECREGRLAEYLAKCPTLLPTAQLLDLDLPNPNPP
jgi:hypothetical protein